MIAGSVVALIGVLLPWVSVFGESGNGLDDFINEDFEVTESPGTVAIIGAVITIGLAIALLVAGRVLAVAIIAVVVSAIGAFLGVGLLGIAGQTADFVDGDVQIGAVLQPIGPLIALAGAIIVLAKRKRPEPVAMYGQPGGYGQPRPYG
jgi:hypothetical protein